MSFLFPLYLLGALAISIPILLHLRRRPPKDHVTFSSLMFLEKSPERLTRRTKIERWLLLALRCIALILLALMFGRPFLKSVESNSGDGEGARLVVLIDGSASMRREDLWTQAMAKAREALEATGPTDEVVVGRFDDKLAIVRPFEAMANLPGSARATSLEEALADSEPSWKATNLGAALTNAADLLGDAASQREVKNQKIVIISDFQEGADRDSLNRYAWPESIVVHPKIVGTEKQPGNLALHLVAVSADADGQSSAKDQATDSQGGIQPPRRRARVTNGRDSESETFSLSWQGEPESKISSFLPAGASRVLAVPPRSDESVDGVLEITGDAHAFDNQVYVARAQPLPVGILYLGKDGKADDVGSPLFYLSRAMHRTPVIDPSVSAMSFDEAGAQLEKIAQAQVVVVRTDGQTPVELAKPLAERAQQGGLVIGIVNEGTESPFLEQLTGLSGLELKEGEVKDYVMLSEVDFEHPVLAPFAQAKIRDFTKIHTWKYRQLTLPDTAADNVRVLARFDTGAPAWIEIAQNNDSGIAGRVILFLSGWEPRESQLALSSKFIPLVYGLLGQAGFSAVAEPTRYVGDAIPLPNAETEVVVTTPGGAVVPLDEGTETFLATDVPGFYTVTSTDALGQAQSRVHAINLPPDESRVETIDPAVALGEFGVLVDAVGVDSASLANAESEAGQLTESQRRRIEIEEKEGNQKLWKWLLVAALGILVIETWLAGRRTSQSVEPAEA
ncbi:MAG: BatA and WFA domain-containing protein [Verrucomicrobiae bacterium]|nr:BatA and WFA domain-containing protein [Verrucomicrobiae bacterium]